MKATINLEFTDEELRHHLADLARRLVFDSIGEFFGSVSLDPQTAAALNHGMQQALAAMIQHQQRPRAQTGPVQVPWGSPGWMAPGPGAPSRCACAASRTARRGRASITTTQPTRCAVSCVSRATECSGSSEIRRRFYGTRSGTWRLLHEVPHSHALRDRGP